jgi:hypothetical protein
MIWLFRLRSIIAWITTYFEMSRVPYKSIGMTVKPSFLPRPIPIRKTKQLSTKHESRSVFIYTDDLASRHASPHRTIEHSTFHERTYVLLLLTFQHVIFLIGPSSTWK